METTQTFTLFWLTGQSELIKGKNIANAFNNAGYQPNALQALDFYSPNDIRNQYYWDENKKTWKSK